MTSHKRPFVSSVGVLDYFVMYRQTVQSVLWNVCKDHRLDNCSPQIALWTFVKSLWLKGGHFDVSPKCLRQRYVTEKYVCLFCDDLTWIRLWPKSAPWRRNSQLTFSDPDLSWTKKAYRFRWELWAGPQAYSELYSPLAQGGRISELAQRISCASVRRTAWEDAPGAHKRIQVVLNNKQILW